MPPKSFITLGTIRIRSAGCALLALLLESGEVLRTQAIRKAQKLQSKATGQKRRPGKISCAAAMRRYKQQGWIEQSKREGKVFVKLTKKGELQALLACLMRGRYQRSARKSGIFWLALFDIPEEARRTRDFLRRFLLGIGFKKLQKSVYISAYPIPETAFRFLEASNLRKFIRFMQVVGVDSLADLRRLCGALR